MRKRVLVFVAAGLGIAWGCIASGQETNPSAGVQPASEPVAVAGARAGEAVSQPTTTQAAGGEEAVKATAEKRTAGVLKALALTDAAAEAKVREVLTAFFVKRITWGPNDDKIKDLEAQLAKLKEDRDVAKVKQVAAQIAALRAELVAMHDGLVAELGKVLTSEQIDTVKDEQTFGRGRLVYNDTITKHVLTDAQKAAIAKLLNEGRDKAWMEGSARDKHKVLDKAVGRVNIYLDALKKLQAIKEAIQAGKLKEAQEIIAKLEQRGWLKELLGQELVDLRTSLEAAKSGPRATSAPATTRPAGD